jgi:hypothetical protein
LDWLIVIHVFSEQLINVRLSAEPQQKALAIADLILNSLVNLLPKIIVIMPVPMITNSRDFAITFDDVLIVRSALYALLGASQSVKQLAKSNKGNLTPSVVKVTSG